MVQYIHSRKLKLPVDNGCDIYQPDIESASEVKCGMTGTEPEEEKKTLQRRVQDSAVWWVSGLVIVAFGAGISAHDVLVKWQTPGKPPAETTTGPKDAYASDVENFLRSETPPKYELDGFTADVDQLNSLMQTFLRTVKAHAGPVPYTDVKDFYVDMDEAADTVTRRALETFGSPGNDPQRQLAYNWKVYCAPSKFRVYVNDLKAAHMAGLSGQQIAAFQDKFKSWRSQDAGVP